MYAWAFSDTNRWTFAESDFKELLMSRRFTKTKQIAAPKRLLRSALAAAALGASFLSLLAPAAHAGGAVYQQHVINAGVLVNDTNGQGTGPTADPAPYLFYVLNNRTDVRPPDLTLVNPLAPTSITAAILNRWTPNVASPTAPYKLGQTVTPDMAPYWEVPLNSVSDSELAQFNVLYLRADSIPYVIPAINEKLRRFVDNGGQLIVEYGFTAGPAVGLFTGTGASAFTLPSPLATTLNFPAVTTAVIAPPVVTQPYFLSSADLVSLFNTLPSGSPLSLTPTGNLADKLHASEFNTVFSPALTEQTSSTPAPAVSTAQIGAGQVVASALRIALTVSPVNTPNSTLPKEPSNVAYFLPQVSPQTAPAPTVPRTPVPSDFYGANTADLKLLTNIVELSETHPGENKTSHGNASGVGLASFSATWQYPVAGTSAAPGAAVWGNFVFVTDAAGILHAFDAFPSENLTGTAPATGNQAGAEQVNPGLSKYPTSSYDEIWQQANVGVGASAPTVASFNGTNYVFVEKPDGSVVVFNAVTGQAAPFTLTAPQTLPTGISAASYPLGGINNAPSPTYYEGRVYAGQANGSMDVYDLNKQSAAGVVTGVFVPLDTTTTQTGPVVGPPAVGMITDGDTNVLVAAVSTPYNVYSVLAGGRNEPMKQYQVNNAITGYSINRSGRYDLNNIFADVNAITPPLLAYDNAGNLLNVTANNTAPSQQDPLFSITTNFSYYTDWNMDFASATGTNSPGAVPTPVNLNYVSTSSYGQITDNKQAAAIVSAPVEDRHGDYYFTETNPGTNPANSYLVGVTPAPLHNNVHIKFRFLIPQKAFDNPEAVNYAQISKLHFVGAPVVDDQDNVYALATDATGTTAATQATVLCFRANQQVTAVVYPMPSPPPTPMIDLTQATIMQDDEAGGEANTIQRGPDANVGLVNATYGQFLSSPTTLEFYNFGKRPTNGQQYEIAGDLTEPQILTATDTSGTMTAPNNTAQLGFRTNLAWFLTPFPVSGPVAGLSLVGGSLFLSDGTSLYRIPTNPSVGTGKQVATVASMPPAALPFKTPIGLGSSANASAAGLGLLGAPPSIGGNVMILNGSTGIEALTRQVTVIADSRRILGVDGDGAAVWSVDATSRTDPATAFATKVAFNHPTALSQFAVNDYLAADTGSNRCVRFDSAGNVRWELTRFSDPYSLMASGQPLTLSQPSSVVVRTLPDTTTRAGTQTLVNPGGSFIFYLVADSGNNRIVEVEDRVRADGTIYVDPVNPNNSANPTINHQLTWVTHTGDRDGRNYRYGSADYYKTTNAGIDTYNVAATVVNTRIGTLAATGGVGAVSSDAPGGSLAVFSGPKVDVTTPSLPKPLPTPPFSTTPTPPSDLGLVVPGFYTASAGASPTYTPFTIRNPRFLKLYTPPGAAAGVNPSSPSFDFLYADDNGIFDLTPNTTLVPNKVVFVAGADRLQFTTANYQAMTTPAFGVTGTVTRNSPAPGLPFIPTCVQALSTDSQPGSSTVTTRRYLITQSYSQGELGGPANAGKIGGEVFEVDVSATGTSTSVTAALSTPVGGFAGNQTLSHPDLTGPLIQPTYAVRLP